MNKTVTNSCSLNTEKFFLRFSSNNKVFCGKLSDSFYTWTCQCIFIQFHRPADDRQTVKKLCFVNKRESRCWSATLLWHEAVCAPPVHLIRLRDLIRVRTGFSFQCSIPGEKQADFALYCRSGRSRICHTSMTPNHLGKSGMQPSRSWPTRQGWRSLLESPTHSMIQRSECVFVHFAIWLVILHLHLFIWQTIFFYYYFFKFYFFSFYLKQLEIEALGLNSLIQAWGYK